MVAKRHGLELAIVYREPNNPYAARLLSRLRASASSVQIPKADGFTLAAYRAIALHLWPDFQYRASNSATFGTEHILFVRPAVVEQVEFDHLHALVLEVEQ